MNRISKHKLYLKISLNLVFKKVNLKLSVLGSTTVTGSGISLESTLLDHDSGHDTQPNIM